MRLTILTLCFCVGSAAICQSAAPTPATPEKQKQPVTQPWMNFNKLPPNWLPTPAAPVPPDPNVSLGRNNAQRDWKMNPQQPLSIGGQAFGKVLMAQTKSPVAQLPSGSWPNAKVEPIPTQWPNAMVEPIPTRWLNDKLLPITAGSGSPVMLHAPTYGDSKQGP
jgi:hypothetical protein